MRGKRNQSQLRNQMIHMERANQRLERRNQVLLKICRRRDLREEAWKEEMRMILGGAKIVGECNPTKSTLSILRGMRLTDPLKGGKMIVIPLVVLKSIRPIGNTTLLQIQEDHRHHLGTIQAIHHLHTTPKEPLPTHQVTGMNPQESTRVAVDHKIRIECLIEDHLKLRLLKNARIQKRRQKKPLVNR
jgi:hypothetical protein